MIKKTYFFGFSTLLLTVALLSVPLTIAQQPDWDYCRVSAYGTNVLEEEIGEIKRMYFNVAIPPAGSNISNTIEVMDYLSGENHTVNLSTGELVLVRYDDINPTEYTVVPASEANHFVIYYEGQIRRIAVNSINIPEFPPILTIPLFMTATLLAILYRRKRIK